jgi:outer membrane protein assembly factor BamD (BamD/ComL family)
MKDYSSALSILMNLELVYNDLELKSLYYSAKLHLHQKNYEKAKANYDKLLSRYPNSKEAEKLKRKFEKSVL